MEQGGLGRRGGRVGGGRPLARWERGKRWGRIRQKSSGDAAGAADEGKLLRTEEDMEAEGTEENVSRSHEHKENEKEEEK